VPGAGEDAEASQRPRHQDAPQQGGKGYENPRRRGKGTRDTNDDYKAGLPPTTYGELAQRCGFDKPHNGRWFGQVTDLIDAACALADVPSFALVRVREANGSINHGAWRKEYSHLRDGIIATALAGSWTDEDFTKILDALAVFSAHGLGHEKAWHHVNGQINREDWAFGVKRAG
jgi:hypothetical protein